MSLIIRSTRVASNTSTGDQDITISGFGTPKAALFILSGATADATAADNLLFSYGVTDGTRQWSGQWFGEHNVNPTDEYATKSTSRCIQTVDNAGAIDGYATFSSWITDGVRINWGDAPPSAYLLTVVLFGGTDLANAYAGSFTPATTLDASVDITAPGFRPTDVIVLRAASGGGRAAWSVGFCKEDGAGTETQYTAETSSSDNTGTSIDTAVRTYSGGYTSGSTVRYQVSLEDFDASGFSAFTRISTTGSTLGDVYYLALQITNVSTKVGYITTPTSTGNQSITDPGFQPQFVMLLPVGAQVVGTNYNDNRAGCYAHIVADASAQYCVSGAEEDAITTSNTQSMSDDQMIRLTDDDGTAKFVGTFVSFDATGWTWNFSATHATGAVWPYWAVEDASGVQILSPTAIATAEAFGTATVVRGTVALLPTAISTAETFGAFVLFPNTTTFVNGFGGDANTAVDVLLSNGWPTFNGGAHTDFDVDPINPQIALLRFILSGIPAGSICISAMLYLYATIASEGAGNTVGSIYHVADANGDWIEGTKDIALASAGEPTWNGKEADGAGGVTTAWAGSAGLGTANTDYETPAIGTFSFLADLADGTEIAIEIDKDIVQAWFGQSTNNGILLKAESGNNSHVGSSDNTTSGYRPKLVVVYVAGVSPTSIPSGETFGSPTITTGATTVLPSSVSSSETIGTVSVGMNVYVYINGYNGDANTAQDVGLNGGSDPSKLLNQGIHGSHEYSTLQNGLYRFILSGIPSSAKCLSATLYLYKSYNLGDGGGTPTVNIYKVLSANGGWIEGTQNLSQALAGEPCWNALDADGAGGVQTAWAGGSNGCGVSGTDHEATSIGGFSTTPTADPYGTEYEITLTASAIEEWFGQATNSGIVLKTSGAGGDHLAQSDFADTALRPRLVVVYAAVQNIAPSSIGSGEAFGSATIVQSGAVLQPTGIATAEAIGTVTITTGAVSLQPSSISTAEAFGTVTVSTGTLIVSPSSIATGEVFGNVTITTGAVVVQPSSITSAEAFGTSIVSVGAVTLQPTGITTGEVFGSLTVLVGAVTLQPSSITTSEAFGSLIVSTGTLVVQPTGITTSEAFGTIIITTGAVSVLPTAIGTAEAFGSATVSQGTTFVQPSSTVTAEAFGTAVVTGGAVVLAPTSISQSEAFGNVTITTGLVSVLPSSISTSEAFGSLVVSSIISVLPSSISTAEAFGTVVLTTGAVSVIPTAIASGEAFGNAVVSAGNSFVVPTSIATAESFGTAVVSVGTTTVLPTAITSGELLGNVTLSVGGVSVLPAGITTSEVFGAFGLYQDLMFINPVSITSLEAFGDSVITLVTWNEIYYFIININRTYSDIVSIDRVFTDDVNINRSFADSIHI